MKERVYKTIIDSAEKLFNRFGISKTAISEVAELAEVSRATVFNNFGNKEGLVEAVLKQKVDDFRQFINNRISGSDTEAQQIKGIIIERLRLLESLDFITDRSLKLKTKYFDAFFAELNEVFIRRVSSILKHSRGESREQMSIANSIFFMLRGIEHGIFDPAGKTDFSGIERDLDYFLRRLLPGGRSAEDA